MMKVPRIIITFSSSVFVLVFVYVLVLVLVFVFLSVFAFVKKMSKNPFAVMKVSSNPTS